MKNLLFIIALAILSSCDNTNYTEKAAPAENKSALSLSAPVAQISNPDQLTPQQEERVNNEFQKKIIRNAEMRFQVSNLDSATDIIEKLALNHQGYISNSNLSATTDQMENEMLIKVPAEQFDDLVKSINGVSIFMNNRSVKTQDVTEEYYDLQSRLKTKYEVKQRYEDILRNKSKTVEDVLKAEEQIGSIQEEIESKEGRLRYLSNQVSYSTIHLNYYQQITVKQEPLTAKHNFWLDISDRFNIGLQIIKALLLGVIAIWPIWLIGIIVTFILRRKVFRKPAYSALPEQK